MSSHNRSAHINISNDDQYRIDFPLELTRLDYLRRILNHIGGAFLITHHRVLEIQKVIDVAAAAKQEETKHQQQQQQEEEAQAIIVLATDCHATSYSTGEMSPAEEDEEELTAHVDLSRPSSPKGRTSITITPTALKKLLSTLIDDGTPKQPVPLENEPQQGKLSKKEKAAMKKKEKKELKKQNLHQSKQNTLHAAWSSTINRDTKWIIEHATFVKALRKLVERSEMVYSVQTDEQVKLTFETSIDTLIVLCESIEECKWYLENVQQLRAQFVKHIAYRRERIHLEQLEERKAKGGTAEDDGTDGPKTNDDGSLQFNYAYDFDQKGVLYWFGTDGNNGNNGNSGVEGKEQVTWENPAVLKKIRAFRSSEGAGLASDICGRERGRYSCTDYRQPRQYYGIDLGPYYRLYPSAYTLRHGSSQGILALRDWTVEGSQDGKKWFPIRKHRADEELPRLAYSTCTWKIEKMQQRKCRMIRIVQTRPVDMVQRLNDASNGKSTEGSKNDDDTKYPKKHPQHHALFLSGMELYGKLVEN